MLFPPILASYMPAYDYSKPVRVYFAISNFNSKSEIAQAQVVCKYQKNNANALSTKFYKNKIKCCAIHEVTSTEDAAIAKTEARFYIELAPADIITGEFDPNTIYKVQIRFSSKPWDSNSPIASLASTASEWSTVCLLKPIIPPKFYVLGLEGDITLDDGGSAEVIVSNLEGNFTGVYIPQTKTETLKSWRIRLFNDTETQLLADTGTKVANSYESDNGRVSFQVQLKYRMSHNNSYHLVYDIETRNGYAATRDYYFTALAKTFSPPEGTITAEINEEDGYAKVVLAGDGKIIHSNITLRRTSSKTNFKIWEDICNKTFANDPLDWEFDDFSIESGVFYQYGYQSRDSRGRRSSMIVSEKVMGEFEDCFLLEKGSSVDDALQLRIQFNMDISNSVINVGEAKTETIGSQYPYVRRNGNMYYKSFPFSFLIAADTDENHLFAKYKELLDNEEELYEAFHNEEYLSTYNGRYDYTYERRFREKVESFLYDDKVKLFKSLTEGNLLIKLMDISLTPVKELGRLLYSVNATAVEIDEVTIDNIDFYGIQKVGTWSSTITFGETKIGQLNRLTQEYDAEGNLQIVEREYPADFNLIGDTGEKKAIETIKSKHSFGLVKNGIKVDDFYISYLRIEIDSDPYLIKNVDGVLTPLDDLPPTDDTIDDNTMLGTLIDINGTIVMIDYPNYIYEMKDSHVKITPDWYIKPIKNTKMVIDYTINLSESVDTSRTASVIVFRGVNGQLAKSFKSKESIAKLIWYKYYVDFYQSRYIERPFYLKAETIYQLDVEAWPGTVFYAKSESDDSMRRFVIDETGFLSIEPMPEDATLTEAYFYGMNVEARALRDRGDSKPDNPRQFDKYIEHGIPYIFYNGAWYPGTEKEGGSYDIPCKVNALVNYYIQTERGYY